MNATRIAVAAAAATGIAAAASFAVATTATANEHTLRLTARSTTSILYIPCPTCVMSSHPEGAHIGGAQIDAGDLYDSGGRKVGHYSLQSVGVTPFSSAGPGELALSALLVLDADQISATGLEEPPLAGGVVAITGGTGRYRSSRGEIHYADNPDGSTTLDVTFAG